MNSGCRESWEISEFSEFSECWELSEYSEL